MLDPAHTCVVTVGGRSGSAYEALSASDILAECRGTGIAGVALKPLDRSRRLMRSYGNAAHSPQPHYATVESPLSARLQLCYATVILDLIPYPS